MHYATKPFFWLRPVLDEIYGMVHNVRCAWSNKELLLDVNHGLRGSRNARLRKYAALVDAKFTNDYETFVWLKPRWTDMGRLGVCHYCTAYDAYTHHELQRQRDMWVAQFTERQVA